MTGKQNQLQASNKIRKTFFYSATLGKSDAAARSLRQIVSHSEETVNPLS